MAINIKCRGVVDATDGSNLYGGFYRLGGGTTDYSRAATPILSGTDGVANGTTAFTSATGGFTAAMVYNGMYEDSTGLYYEIVAYVSTNEVTLDRTIPANTGITFNVGGSWAAPTDVLAELIYPAGGISFENNGTVVMTENILVSFGETNATRHHPWRGIVADESLRVYDTDRPTVSFGAYKMTASDTSWTVIQDLIVTGNVSGYVLDLGNSAIYDNLSVSNIHATGSGVWIDITARGYNLSVTCPNTTSGTGIRVEPAGFLKDSYVYDLNANPASTGIYAYTYQASPVINTIIDNCSYGANLNFSVYGIFEHNTIIDCVTGLLFSGNALSGRAAYIDNNIFTGCTEAVEHVLTPTAIMTLTRNCFFGNTADIGNTAAGGSYPIVKGYGTITTDPALDANYYPQGLSTFAGAGGFLYSIPGAVQIDISAGGGGGQTAYGFFS